MGVLFHNAYSVDTQSRTFVLTQHGALLYPLPAAAIRVAALCCRWSTNVEHADVRN